MVEVERLAGEHRQPAKVTDLANGTRPHLLAETPMATGPLRPGHDGASWTWPPAIDSPRSGVWRSRPDSAGASCSDWRGTTSTEGSVHVQRQVLLRPRAVQGTPRLFVRSTLKNRRARRVRLDEQTAAELHRWKATQSAERLEFGRGVEDGRRPRRTGRVDRDGGGRDRSPPGHAARTLETAGEAGRRPGDPATRRAALLRRARALSSGVRLDVVSRTLGHSSSAFTADQYSHDNDEAAAEAADRIGAVLRAIAPGEILGKCEGAGRTGPFRLCW